MREAEEMCCIIIANASKTTIKKLKYRGRVSKMREAEEICSEFPLDIRKYDEQVTSVST